MDDTARVRRLRSRMARHAARWPDRPRSPTSATRPPTASRRSRSTAPRCATPSGPGPPRSSSRRSTWRAMTPTIGVVILTGEGPLAFCSGGDQSIRGDDGYVDDHGVGRLNVLDLQIQIRRTARCRSSPWWPATRSAAATCCTCAATCRSRPTTRGSARPAHGWARSTADTASTCWPGRSARSAPRRSGSCAASTTPPRRSTGGWSTPSCPSRTSSARPCRGAGRCWRCRRWRCAC